MKIGEYLTKKFRVKLFEKYMRLDQSFHDDDSNSPANLLSRLSNDTRKIETIALSIIGLYFHILFAIALCLPLAFSSDTRISLINLGFFPLVGFISFIGYKLQQKLDNLNNNTITNSSTIISESVNATKTVFAYNIREQVVQKFHDSIKESNSKFIYFLILKSFVNSIGQFLIFALYACVFIVSGIIIKKDSLNIMLNVITGHSFDPLEYIRRMIRCIFSILFTALGIGLAQQAIGDSSTAKQALYNIYSLMDKQTKIDQLSKGVKKEIKGKIEFKDVTFSYTNSLGKNYRTILEKFNLTINEGESIGIVGNSGCGKSTIIQLLLRFYDPQVGNINIDGVDIKQYDLTDLRKQIGIVSQEPVLFKQPLCENIKYGKQDANNNEIISASSKCLVDHLIRKEQELFNLSIKNNLTDEVQPLFFLYDEEEDSKNDSLIPISGGEKQRVALARLIIKNPSIILLDEATSALDQENEDFITNLVNKEFKNKTKIIIAHKLKTIETCDRIIVLDQGEIREIGSHQELINANGIYSQMINIQQK